MSQDRWDPEMRAFTAMMEERGRAFPPVKLELPLDAARVSNNGPGEALAAVSGPAMAESGDRWLPVRGRRLACRVQKPRTDAALPVMVYIHGGGWVWGSIDTHDHIMRGYAAAGDCAIVAPDYALSPEAPFPQALEECAAVVRWVASQGAEWGLDPSRIVIGGDSAGGNLAVAVALLLRQTDPEMIRVLEDLIHLLTTKGVLRITDLPAAAQHKLVHRSQAREGLGGLNRLIGDDDNSLI